MNNKSFRLQSPGKIGVGGNWYLLMRCKEHTGITVNLHPTLETKGNNPARHHEWDVPDTEYNRAHVARFMPDYKIIEVAEKKAPPVSKPKPEPKTDSKPAKGAPLNPRQVGELKSKIREELDSAGINYSKTASLSELQKLQANPTK